MNEHLLITESHIFPHFLFFKFDGYLSIQELTCPLRCKGLRLSFGNLMGYCSAGLNVFDAISILSMEL